MKFNVPTRHAGVTTNHEGEKAYLLSPAFELYAAVVTTALSDTFYEPNDSRTARLRSLVARNDPFFVAQLAVYAREKMHLRSVPLVLAVELARVHSGDGLVGRLVSRLVQRADEITELLAYYQLANARTGVKKLNLLSKQVQRGLAEAFNRFDEYQFAKYNRDAEVKLRDALFLVHPKAKSADQQALFDKIAGNALQTPYTWEVELSAAGQVAYESEADRRYAFRDRWETLVESGKLGYMALLRNLRNILQAEVGAACIARVAARLGNAREVANARQLPFRFLSAYRELKQVSSVHVGEVLDALEKAMQASAANLRGFDRNTRVLIACDTSGSMQQPVSPRSTVQLYDIGLVLGMLLQSRCEAVVTGMFGNIWKVVNLPRQSILANADELRRREGEVGYATNGYLVIKDLVKRQRVMDKVMIFTDCQLWNSHGSGESLGWYWKEYKRIAPAARLYLFDLAGYGQAPLRVESDDVYLVAGWSDKVFEVLEAVENGGSALTEIGRIVV
jgi:hypothetical protein